MKFKSKLALCSFIGLFFSAAFLLADTEPKKHRHQGIIKPHNGKPSFTPLTETEKALLQSGKPVFQQIEEKHNGRKYGTGIARFIVKAPADNVWKNILSFKQYPKWIDGIQKIEIYKKNENDIFVEFGYQKFFKSVNYFIKHHVGPEKERWMTWTLDYDRRSDFDDNVGAWFVEPNPVNENESIVSYSVSLKLKGITRFFTPLIQS